MPRIGCTDCGGKLPPRQSGGLCPGCKIEARRLYELRQQFSREECPADKEGRELRVAMYSAVVQNGGRLFEERE